MGSIFFLGIDTGTQGVRVGICDTKGKLVSQANRKFDTFHPEVGYAEQNPTQWWELTLEALKECCSKISTEQRQKIIAACVCSTSSTILTVDKEGNPLSPAMMWMDNRSIKQAQAISAAQHPVLDHCGNFVSMEWAVSKSLWIKEENPSLYNSAYKIIEQLDWINFKLTGEMVTANCNATCKWNYVKELGGFDDEYFASIGFSDYKTKWITDRVLKYGEEIGVIKEEITSLLDINSNVLLVQGGIDAHTSMFGLNCISPGKLGIIMGTSFVHLSLSSKSNFSGIWGPYKNAVIEDLYLLEGGQTSAGSLVNWFVKNFDIKGENPYELMKEQAERIPPGSEGLITLDFFQGNRTPYKDEDAKGAITGLTLKHTSAHIYRSILEAVACGTRNIIDNFESQEYIIDEIIACGGVTKDSLWIQMISDISGKIIKIPETSQAGIMGCCVVAASCGRYYKDFQQAADNMIHIKKTILPNTENKKVYDQLFNNYINLYKEIGGSR